MVGIQDHHAVLDSLAYLCSFCAYHAEVALRRAADSWHNGMRSGPAKLAHSPVSACRAGGCRDGPFGRRSMELKNKRVLVVGLGRSGAASAFFLQDHGAKVTVSDEKSEAQLQNEIAALLDRGVSIETGRHGERTFRDQDLIVVSPGVPSDQPQLQHARTLGVPVIGEVELAFRFLQGKVIAITGSNGKTTTTTLVGEILAKSGKKTLVGGNIGTPVISLAPQSTP